MQELELLERRLKQLCPEMELRVDEPMCRHTSFRVGGPVRLMALPKDEEECAAAMVQAAQLGIKPFCIGNGSNLLVRDEGADCFVIKTVDGMDALRAEETCIFAGSGVSLARLANFALGQGLTGLEFAHGIPGSLGGAVTMNAGAYDGEMAQVVQWVRVMLPDGKIEQIEQCDFSYRHSAFSDGQRLILGAYLQLRRGDRDEIRATMDDLMARRKSKQPLEFPSAGSTFKRPTGYYAAALIDRCGLKGLRVGGAQVSEKHAGFIINTGGATCADILELMERVREKVLRETGVLLEPEVKLLGG